YRGMRTQSVELRPRHVDRAVERARRAAVDPQRFMVGELPVRTLRFPVAIPARDAREGLRRPSPEPRPAAIGRPGEQEVDLKRRGEVESLAREVGRAIRPE